MRDRRLSIPHDPFRSRFDRLAHSRVLSKQAGLLRKAKVPEAELCEAIQDLEDEIIEALDGDPEYADPDMTDVQIQAINLAKPPWQKTLQRNPSDQPEKAARPKTALQLAQEKMESAFGKAPVNQAEHVDQAQVVLDRDGRRKLVGKSDALRKAARALEQGSGVQLRDDDGEE
jgi:hypothetical protein